MIFAHDSEVALQSAVELVGSTQEPDALATLADLEGFLARWQYTGRRDGTVAELDAVRAVRCRLRALLLAGPEEAARLLNEILEQVTLCPRVVRHDGYGWHLHAVDHDAPLAERILVETVMAMVDVLRSEETSRLFVCADDTCEGVVLDLSRNRSRRYCSTACGNRNAVAAYRARQAR